MNNLTSPSFPSGIEPLRSESEVRAIRTKRCAIEAQMRVEGSSEADIARLATDETAEKMLAYDRQVMGIIAGLFGALT